jgi:hypothetical protein
VGEWRYSSTILASALDGGEWSDSRPGSFNPGTHWMGVWVGLRADLDTVEKRKILPCRKSNPARPTHGPSLYRLHNFTVQISLHPIKGVRLVGHVERMGEKIKKLTMSLFENLKETDHSFMMIILIWILRK